MASTNNPLTAGPEGASHALDAAKSALATANKHFPSPAKETTQTTPKVSYRAAHKARGGSISDLADQAGHEDTKPREDAMKSLSGGTGAAAL
jgi:hypothetical protein